MPVRSVFLLAAALLAEVPIAAQGPEGASPGEAAIPSQGSAGQPTAETPGTGVVAASINHGIPPCNYGNSSCVWGQVWDITGGQLPGQRAMKKGPIDVCHSWDSTCSAPVQTVCKLHGAHGGGSSSYAEGSYFFVLPRNQGWRIKPRVTGSHLSWTPASKTVSQGVTAGSIRIFNFSLLGTAASTSTCK